jgi:hypothetical protein
MHGYWSGVEQEWLGNVVGCKFDRVPSPQTEDSVHPQEMEKYKEVGQRPK